MFCIHVTSFEYTLTLSNQQLFGVNYRRMAFVNEPPAGGFFCGVVVPTFGKNHFDRTGCAWHGSSWMFESIFALHGVWFSFLSLFFFGLNSTQRSLHGSKFSKQLLRPPLTQRFSYQLVRILNFSPSSFQPKILWVLVASPPENPGFCALGNLLLCHGSPVPGVHGYAAMAALGGNSLPLRSTWCHRGTSDRCTRRRKTTWTTGWTTGGGGIREGWQWMGKGKESLKKSGVFEQIVGLGWKHHLITFSVFSLLGYIFFLGGHYFFKVCLIRECVVLDCRILNSRSVMLRIKGRCSSGHRTSDERHRVWRSFLFFVEGGYQLGYFSRWFGESICIIWIEMPVRLHISIHKCWLIQGPFPDR